MNNKIYGDPLEASRAGKPGMHVIRLWAGEYQVVPAWWALDAGYYENKNGKKIDFTYMKTI